MNFTRTEMAGIASSLALVVLSAVFALGQGVGVAHADVDGGSINSGVYSRLCEDGMIFFSGCVVENPDSTDGGSEDSDPCDLPGMSANPECSGENTGPNPDPCTIFDQMGNLPPHCSEGNGGGGGGGGGGSTAACADGVDNDNDGLVDSADPDCADAADNDESNSGGGGGGGGGSVMPQCRDSYDNDLDGLTDANDPDCADSEDNDESAPAATGGGGGGGGGGGYLSTATTTASSTGSVLGSATTTPASCDAYLTAFIKQGNKNDEEQVKRLQYVLKNFESAAVDENGVYDMATLAAVHAFQTKYASEILAPWNIAKSTGYVYLTTRKKLNEIYCKREVAFPLSHEENMLIEATKVTPTPVAAKPKPAAAPATGGTKKPAEAAKPTTTSSTTDAQESPVSRPWGSVGDFLRRLFNR